MLDTWLDPDGRFLGAARPLPLDTPFDVHVARERGVSPRTLTNLERRGLLRRELRGVYVAAQVPHDMRTRVEALRWVVSDDQVVCDRTAAWLWGVAALPRSARWVPPALDVCSVVETTRARRVGVTGTRRGLMPTDIELVDGLAVTTPARTALDLGRLLRPLEAIAALDGFRGLGVPLDVLRLEVARFRGYRGVVQLRRLVPLSDSRSQSPGESALRLCWHDAGLPPPEPQHEVPHDQGSSYFIDVADGPTRFGAEYDGEDHHTSAADRAHDDERRRWLRAQAAWTIEVFTKHDVYPRDADPVARLARAYAVHRRDTQLWTPGWRPSTAVVSTARSASWG